MLYSQPDLRLGAPTSVLLDPNKLSSDGTVALKVLGMLGIPCNSTCLYIYALCCVCVRAPLVLQDRLQTCRAWVLACPHDSLCCDGVWVCSCVPNEFPIHVVPISEWPVVSDMTWLHRKACMLPLNI